MKRVEVSGYLAPAEASIAPAYVATMAAYDRWQNENLYGAAGPVNWSGGRFEDWDELRVVRVGLDADSPAGLACSSIHLNT